MNAPTTVLDTKLIPLDALKPHPENARQGNIEMIKESLESNGQYRAITVRDSTRDILAGNHTYLAAKQLGWNEILVSLVECDDVTAKKILLVDNRANDVAGYDDAALAALLEGLMLAGQLQGTGFAPDDVDDLMSKIDAIAETEPEEFQGGYADTDGEFERRGNAEVTPMRQFVLLYEREVAEEFEGNVRKLLRAWGVAGMRDVIAEAVRRAAAEAPQVVAAEEPNEGPEG